MATRPRRIINETPEQQAALAAIERGLAANRTPPPATEYVVRVQFESRGWVYPRGTVLDDLAVLGPNADIFLSGPSARVAEQPAGRGNRSVKPYRKAAPAPVAPNKPLVFVDDSDPVRAWQLTVQANTEGADTLRAKDRLLACEKGSRMYLQAAKVAADRNARERRLNGQRPLPVGL